MRQSRLMSLVEAVANVVVGYAVAVVAQIVVFPMFGLAVSLGRTSRSGWRSPASRWCGATCCGGFRDVPLTCAGSFQRLARPI